MDKFRHTGKVAIVTGAGNGIGRATVVRLAREDAAVIGCDVNEAALNETDPMDELALVLNVARPDTFIAAPATCEIWPPAFSVLVIVTSSPAAGLAVSFVTA